MQQENRVSAVGTVAVLTALWCGLAWGGPLIDPKFSVDPASPAIFDDGVTPDDILVTGPVIHTQGRDMDLVDNFLLGVYDDLDALSFGRDPITAPLYFSVDRVAVGLPGSAVFAQAQPGAEEAAGDVYRALPPVDSNSLYLDEQTLGLTPGFFGDDLNALELDSEPAPWVYFSIDYLSITNLQGGGDLAASILVSDRDENWTIYAPYTLMGLQDTDDLDALVLWDKKLDPVATLGEDVALFSLDSFSPTVLAGLASPADILRTNFDGSFTVWKTADLLGLAADDELNALDTVVPTPAPLLLLIPGLGLLHRSRRRTHRRFATEEDRT